MVGSIYGNCSFRFDPLTNMAIIGNSWGRASGGLREGGRGEGLWVG